MEIKQKLEELVMKEMLNTQSRKAPRTSKQKVKDVWFLDDPTPIHQQECSEEEEEEEDVVKFKTEDFED